MLTRELIMRRSSLSDRSRLLHDVLMAHPDTPTTWECSVVDIMHEFQGLTGRIASEKQTKRDLVELQEFGLVELHIDGRRLIGVSLAQTGTPPPSSPSSPPPTPPSSSLSSTPPLVRSKIGGGGVSEHRSINQGNGGAVPRAAAAAVECVMSELEAARAGGQHAVPAILDAVVDAMRSLGCGVQRAQAARLLDEVGPETLERQLRWLPRRRLERFNSPWTALLNMCRSDDPEPPREPEADDRPIPSTPAEAVAMLTLDELKVLRDDAAASIPSRIEDDARDAWVDAQIEAWAFEKFRRSK